MDTHWGGADSYRSVVVRPDWIGPIDGQGKLREGHETGGSIVVWTHVVGHETGQDRRDEGPEGGTT
jgi:hypothetical protein